MDKAKNKVKRKSSVNEEEPASKIRKSETSLKTHIACK